MTRLLFLMTLRVLWELPVKNKIPAIYVLSLETRENFLSEVKLLQRLNLYSPVLLLLYVVFLIILSLHNFQASDFTGSGKRVGREPTLQKIS